jgi:hypothetical protein
MFFIEVFRANSRLCPRNSQMSSEDFPQLFEPSDERGVRRRKRSESAQNTFGPICRFVLREPGLAEATTTGIERLVHRIAAHDRGGRTSEDQERVLRRAARTSTVEMIRASGIALRQKGETQAPAESRRASRLARVETLLRSLALRWGPDFRDPRLTLLRLRSLEPARLIGETVLRWQLSHAQAKTEPERKSWLQAQMWGILADVYLADLRILCRDLLLVGRSQEAEDLLGRQLSLIDQSSLNRVRSLRDPASGLLLSGAHAGAFGVGRATLKSLYDDLLYLGARGHDAPGRRVTTDDPVRALFTLVKHLRRPGSLAIVGADGKYGKAKSEVELLGRTLSVSHGTPHAIYHAKCKNAFFLAAWQDDSIVMKLQFVQLDKAESLRAWTERWIEAYRAFLCEIVTGDPRNMRGYSGFWT